MQSAATLITSLVYSRFPGIEFADLVDELDTALGGTGRWDGDSNAIFEVEGSRVVIGLEDHRPQPDAYRKLTLGAEATLVLSIGPGPDPELPSPLQPHRHTLLSALAERINRTYPCNLMLWSETEEVFEPSRYAPLVSLSAFCNADMPTWQDMALPDAPRTAKERKAPPRSIKMLTRKFHTLNLTAAPMETAAIPLLVPIDLAPPAPVAAQVAVRAEVRAEVRADLPIQIAAVAPPPRVFADAVPQVAASDPAVPQALRLVAAAEPLATEPAGSLPQRLTIYVMNMMLMLVALPIGCALLVYNMVRGEDLRTSARAIAMASTLIGLAQLAGVPNMMYLV